MDKEENHYRNMCIHITWLVTGEEKVKEGVAAGKRWDRIDFWDGRILSKSSYAFVVLCSQVKSQEERLGVICSSLSRNETESTTSKYLITDNGLDNPFFLKITNSNDNASRARWQKWFLSFTYLGQHKTFPSFYYTARHF